ncbi:hypothetical protein R2R32_02575 [Clostridium perfringens]|nr:hypothetical protein [Clostridium perfringens]
MLDDWIDKNMYKEMYKICEDFNVDIIASDTINYVSKFEYSYTKELDIDSGIYTKDEIFRKILPRLFYCCSFNSMWNKIFKKEIVIKNNIMLDEKLYYVEDWKFIVEFLKYTESLAYIDKAYYYYRRGYESLSCKYKDNTFEHNGITLYNNRKLYAKYFGVNTNLGERDLYNTFVHCVISEVRRKDINIRNKIINIKKMLDYKELEYSACCLKKERLKIKEKLNLKLIEKKNVFGIYFYGIIAILLDSIRKKLI